VKVNGEDADPLFKFLQEQKGFAGWDPNHNLTAILEDMLSKADPDYKQKADIKWNFTKFLINKKGQVIARFEPTTKIEVIEEAIKEELNK
jgi:glutathione peroxidase